MSRKDLDAAHATATQLVLVVRNVPIYPDSAIASLVSMARSVRIEIVYGDVGLPTLPVPKVVTMAVLKRELGHAR